MEMSNNVQIAYLEDIKSVRFIFSEIVSKREGPLTEIKDALPYVYPVADIVLPPAVFEAFAIQVADIKKQISPSIIQPTGPNRLDLIK